MIVRTTWLFLQLLVFSGSLKSHRGSKSLAISAHERRHEAQAVKRWCLSRCNLVDRPARCEEVCSQRGANARLARTRRDSGVTDCSQVKSSTRPEGVVPPQEVFAEFGVRGNDSRLFVNITWKPLNEGKWNVSNWEGYIVRYIGEDTGSFPKIKCALVPKNQTYYVIGESDDWKYPEILLLNVSTCPVSNRSPTHDLKKIHPPCVPVRKTESHERVPQELSTSFVHDKVLDRWYINVTWKPLDELAWNVSKADGYIVRYNGIPKSGGIGLMVTKCAFVPKSQTQLIIPESKDGWEYPDILHINVSTYPIALRQHNLKMIEPPTFPTAFPAVQSPLPSTKVAPGQAFIAAMSTMGILIGSILVVIAALLWARKRKKRIRLPRQSTAFEYDAFIVYSSKDREFMENTLLPLLEGEFRLRCCVHHRDFVPGAPYAQNIVNSVLKSRKIVVVMSKNFLESNFCDYELQVAMQRLLEWRDDSILVIKVGSLGKRQMPVLLKKRSYIDYTELVERVNLTDRLRRFFMKSEGVQD